MAGTSIANIFKEDGESGFRDLESQVLGELAAFGRSVVATGGGVVLRPINWGHLHTGVTVWLDAPIDMLAARIVGDKSTADSRPLMAQAASADGADAAFQATKEKLRVMIEARRALYAQSDVHVSLLGPGDDDAITSGRIPAGIAPEAVAERVLRAVADRLQEGRERRAAEEITNAERFSIAVGALFSDSSFLASCIYFRPFAIPVFFPGLSCALFF